MYGRTEVRKFASANIINYELINNTVDRLTYRTDVRLYGCTMNITIGLTNLLDKLTYGPTDQQGLNIKIKINKLNS